MRWAVPRRDVVDVTVPWAPGADLIGVNVPRPLWLAMRRRGVGGSDASAVWGINPYTSAYQLWVEKMGLSTFEDSEAARWGRLLEGPVATEAAERYRWEVQEWGQLMFQSRTRPWQLANPDRLIYEADGTPVGLEIKTTSAHLSDEWDDGELPAHALLQAVHCMAVLGTGAWWVAGLIGGQKLVCYRVVRDLVLERLLIDAEEAFWQKVVDGTPPDPDGSKATTDAMTAWFSPSDPELVVQLDGGQVEMVRQLNDAKASVKAAEKVRDELANQLRQMLGHAEVAVTPDGQVAATWKQQADRRVSVPREFVERAAVQRRPGDVRNITLTAPGHRALLTKKV